MAIGGRRLSKSKGAENWGFDHRDCVGWFAMSIVNLVIAKRDRFSSIAWQPKISVIKDRISASYEWHRNLLRSDEAYSKLHLRLPNPGYLV